ncbi:hypothetical protein M3J07_007487 [Ascochyta lentis]
MRLLLVFSPLVATVLSAALDTRQFIPLVPACLNPKKPYPRCCTETITSDGDPLEGIPPSTTPGVCTNPGKGLSVDLTLATRCKRLKKGKAQCCPVKESTKTDGCENTVFQRNSFDV